MVRSKNLGQITDLLGLHSSRLGRVRGIISGGDPKTQATSEISYHLIKRNPQISRPSPQTLELVVNQAFKYSYYSPESAHYMLEVSNAYVLPANGWVLTRNREFIVESLFKPELVITKGVRERVLWPKVKRVKETLFLAYKGWSLNNYYHWMLEFLPKISAFLDPPTEECSELFKSARLLLPSKLTPWMTQSLSMLGLGEEKHYRAEGHQLNVERLLFIPEFGTLHSLPGWAIEWLRGRFSVYMDLSGMRTKRIYVSRRNAKTRRVQNEDQVLHLLSRYGFEEVILEELSLAEQISLFSQAEIVVGPHGAGFSNLVFSTGATLIDILDPGQPHWCFYNLCYDTNQYYWYLMGEIAVQKDINVDVDKLQRTLDKAVEQRDLKIDVGLTS